MIEVLKAYNYSEATFSLAVTIMDTYFAKASRYVLYFLDLLWIS